MQLAGGSRGSIGEPWLLYFLYYLKVRTEVQEKYK